MPWLPDFEDEMFEAITRAGLDPDDFEFEEEVIDPRQGLGYIPLSDITVRRKSIGMAIKYKVGGGETFPATFVENLETGFFGSAGD